MEGTPRSGEEAVYAGFGLEQTQRGARRVGLTTTPIKLSQEPLISITAIPAGRRQSCSWSDACIKNAYGLIDRSDKPQSS